MKDETYNALGCAFLATIGITFVITCILFILILKTSL